MIDVVRYSAFLLRWVCSHGAPLINACLILLITLTCGPTSDGREPPSLKAAVLVSRHIRPYLEAVEGLKAGLSKGSKADIEIIGIGELGLEDKADLSRRLSGETLDLLIGVGPEAGLFVWNEVSNSRAVKLYLMVLNPDKVFGPGDGTCGVSLNIPVHIQVETIQKGLPSIRRPGLLYDPQINSDFFSKAAAAASSSGLRIVPLKISSKKDIPSVLESQWGEVDSLWLIPDRTAVSESIVHYVIKEAFIRNAPVIGYNRFFYDAGAALAFVFDYEELGRECAQEALKAAAGKPCGNTPPLFHVWLNPLVAEKLGLKIPEKYAPPIGPGP
jgi:putative tryptophan/tyrosine transport system substrate-binding protein